jgi:hypothetical protein
LGIRRCSIGDQEKWLGGNRRNSLKEDEEKFFGDWGEVLAIAASINRRAELISG